MYRRTRLALTLVLLSLLGTCAPAHADSGDPDVEYFFDGGAVPFIYVAGIGAGALELFGTPPAAPRFFDSSEGYQSYNGDTVPTWLVMGAGGLAGAAMIAIPTDARWYHIKGFMQALATTGLITSIAKYLVGRHRPDFNLDNPRTNGDDGRKSFFSGHASFTLTITTYMGLYLRRHVFAPMRSAGSTLPWWEAVTYAGLLGASVYVPLSRVIDHRHHPTDVLTGSLVGASLAATFYVWQEQRYTRRRTRDATSSALLAPTISPAGATFLLSF